MTRPNLAPVAAVIIAAVIVHDWARNRSRGPALRAGVLFALPLAASAALLAWLNTRLYGSPFASGYGPASQLFALDNIPSNAARYVRWLLDTQTPILLLGLATPAAAAWRRR